MLRILLASYGSLKTRGGWFYGTAQKLQNGFVRLGHDVEFFSDRDIARASSPLRSRILGRRACNRIFRDYVRNFDPDLIVLCHADLIADETLAAVRTIGRRRPIVEIRVDALHNVLTLPHLRRRAPHLDRIFVTTAGPALGLVGTPSTPASFIPNPVDSGMETGRAHLVDTQPFDLFYSRRPVIKMPRNDYRAALIATMEKDARLKVSSIGIHGGKQVFGQTYFRLIGQARIGLNLSVKAMAGIDGVAPVDLMRLYSSDRIAHYGGNGLLVMDPTEFGLREIMVEDREFLGFVSPEEAREKALWLVAHPAERMTIAAAGHAAFHQRFSSEAVARHIVAKSFGDANVAAAWPDDDHRGNG